MVRPVAMVASAFRTQRYVSRMDPFLDLAVLESDLVPVPRGFNGHDAFRFAPGREIHHNFISCSNPRLRAVMVGLGVGAALATATASLAPAVRRFFLASPCSLAHDIIRLCLCTIRIEGNTPRAPVVVAVIARGRTIGGSTLLAGPAPLQRPSRRLALVFAVAVVYAVL